MLVFKLEDQTMDEVTRIFETLQSLIPLDIYKNLFQVILTDNGHEFLMLIILNASIQLANMLLIYFWVIHTPLDNNLFYVGIVHLVFKNEQFLHILTWN